MGAYIETRGDLRGQSLEGQMRREAGSTESQETLPGKVSKAVWHTLGAYIETRLSFTSYTPTIRPASK